MTRDFKLTKEMYPISFVQANKENLTLLLPTYSFFL